MTMKTVESAHWMPCDSRSDMRSRTSGRSVLDELETSGANTWGYFEIPQGLQLNIGYADVGLEPKSVLVGDKILIGIDECLACYDISTHSKCFSYQMPWIFHEFVAIGDPLIVRDEMGFVCLTLEGKELWKFGTPGIIESYKVSMEQIIGKTTDGQSFVFDRPA
jgi:hypothetical protein